MMKKSKEQLNVIFFFFLNVIVRNKGRIILFDFYFMERNVNIFFLSLFYLIITR
jgi:hypothetical protein